MSLLKIRNKIQSIPIIQGGMGVGVSLERLAGAVAKCGGVGSISTADCGYREPDFDKAPEEANLRALKNEIKEANRLSEGHGLIAVNAMVATRQYAEAVKTAVSSGIDAVISGAGLPLELPEYVPEGSALIAPIVSSGRTIKLIARKWERSYKRYPDFVVLEGPKAGGHLGFKEEDLLSGSCPDVFDILKNVIDELKPFVQAAGREIPVFLAGGIWSKEDIQKALSKGAEGVQMATRFIATKECDASTAFKKILINSKKEDVKIIHSPVGMPGRAIETNLIKRLETEKRIPPTKCSRCIKTCNVTDVPFCITHALIEAVKGNIDEGLFFTGSNIDKLTEIVSTKDLIASLGY
ncbi:NAD(P)H-dependent flavin oxidoreductase [Butyrivibrio sp. NC3005]|uniref:NAD(P)H-dependent flavin oxidoreductase n=1 Tax=Butyrivibrio sp. NC3005 TaxID=1280685 RepID=UPI0003F808DA|nr:nitronate monooxygenase family protein [Butyrivibrio sp. NC3005]